MEKNGPEIKPIDRFLSLPDNVLETVYKLLGPKEYLALRLTCKETKEWVDSYYNTEANSHMLEHFKDCCFQIIYQSFESDHQSLANFVKADVRNITNFDIGNWSFLEIYKDPAFQEFASIYSFQIRKLKISHYLNSETKLERDFFSSLTRLEDIEICAYSISAGGIKTEEATQPSALPFLQNLKSLKIIEIEFKSNVGIQNEMNYWFYNVMDVCPKLEFLKMPLIGYMFDEYGRYDTESKFIEKGINTVLREKEPGTTSLKTIDLNRFQLNDGNNKEIEELYNLCALHNIEVVSLYWRG